MANYVDSQKELLRLSGVTLAQKYCGGPEWF